MDQAFGYAFRALFCPRCSTLLSAAAGGGIASCKHCGTATHVAGRDERPPSQLSSAGGCEPEVVIGVEGDAALGNAKIQNARQFKIGYPTQDDWRWNGEASTFMALTVGQVPGCSKAQRNNAYALYDSAGKWAVQYRADGCPELFEDIQAPAPLHLGGARYKLYSGQPSVLEGKVPNNMLPFLGPKRVLYADGARSGAASVVEFADWEPLTSARGTTWLWPDGSVLDAGAEGYIDDFVVIAPTADLAFQVMYVAITDGSQAPFSAMAVLVNQ